MSDGYAPILRHMAAGATKTAIVHAYTMAFRYLWATMAGISGLGLAISFLIAEHSLDARHDPTHNLRSKEMLSSDDMSSSTRAKRISDCA